MGSNGYRIDGEIAVYLSNAAKLSPKTYKAYKLSLGLFRQSCKKPTKCCLKNRCSGSARVS